MKIGTMISANDAFKNGLNSHGFQVVEIDPQQFTEQERRLIVEKCPKANAQSDFRDKADFHINVNSHDWPELTVERVKELAQKWAKDDTELEAKKEKFLADFFAMTNEEVFEKFVKWSYSSYSFDTYRDFHKTLEQSEEAMERIKHICAAKTAERKESRRKEEEEQAKKTEELRIKNEAARLEREKEEERLTSLLRTWAVESGSELLKERINGGFEWLNLAQNEYADIEFAKLGMSQVDDPFDDYETDTNERTTPTLEEIKAMNHAKTALPEADIKLVWCKYTNNDYECYDEEDEKVSRCELEVSIKCPNGCWKTRYFKPEIGVTVE